MTIIVFLVDTSASMNQRAYLGGRPSLLDVAKGAVETFVKVSFFSNFCRASPPRFCILKKSKFYALYFLSLPDNNIPCFFKKKSISLALGLIVVVNVGNAT